MSTASRRAQFRLQSKELISQTLTAGKRGRQTGDNGGNFPYIGLLYRL